ncbi:decaprenyl-phosphate phosphoribosyltransferase [Actinospica sp.]|uniref:decaprenyl-phosphate phosphoribosyltransferase n=1 Tax=Actinospica sp. TaxID=1872142 RepID=UPI002CAA4EEB|nr:decaprenyl-phosphate phosphoribosyltransferase [Actinospica sp.]HWG26833.1 decaprenyl-phosphate phosphoribosyltransferase [Actinospica sp.]
MSSFPAQQQQNDAAEPDLTAPADGGDPRDGAAIVSRSLLAGLFREARPKQWIKNVLVLTAPLASGTITHRQTLGPVAVAFVAFCLAASAVYYANDALDVEADRAHPTKRNRPIAAGIIPLRLAWVCVLVLSAASLAVAMIDNAGTVAVIAVYLVMHLAYSAWFKHVLVLDLALVASGFLLRAMIGGVAAGIPLSQWFLLTTGFASLFMVAGKRYSELELMGEDAAVTRRALAGYTPSYLRFIWQTMVGLTILTYSLWAFDLGLTDRGVRWHELSIVPWAFVFLRYAMFVDAGQAGEPEDVVLGDRVIMGIGLAWLVLFALGVFVNGH